MNALRHLPPKTPRLIRLLGSDVDGEVLGAARGLGRVLQAAGLDFHDLADSIAQPSEPAPKLSPSLLVPKLEHLTRDALTSWMQSIASWPAFSEWERAFSTDIAKQTFTQPHRTLTVKQAKIVNVLLKKAWFEGIRP